MRASVLLMLLLISLEASDPLPCHWYGASPICIAQCPSGTKEVMRADHGRTKVFGKSCLLGSKVFCCEDGYLPKYNGRANNIVDG